MLTPPVSLLGDCIHAHTHMHAQASTFKLMGNFTLFGMVEVMCEVGVSVIGSSPGGGTHSGCVVHLEGCW